MAAIIQFAAMGRFYISISRLAVIDLLPTPTVEW